MRMERVDGTGVSQLSSSDGSAQIWQVSIEMKRADRLFQVQERRNLSIFIIWSLWKRILIRKKGNVEKGLCFFHGLFMGLDLLRPGKVRKRRNDDNDSTLKGKSCQISRLSTLFHFDLTSLFSIQLIHLATLSRTLSSQRVERTSSFATVLLIACTKVELPFTKSSSQVSKEQI